MEVRLRRHGTHDRGRQIVVIARELEKAFPELVTKWVVDGHPDGEIGTDLLFRRKFGQDS